MVYGFDYEDRPLEPAIEHWSCWPRTKVMLGSRCEAAIGTLIHPVHRSGRLLAWEVLARRQPIV
jgi:hypothetical protein